MGLLRVLKRVSRWVDKTFLTPVPEPRRSYPYYANSNMLPDSLNNNIESKPVEHDGMPVKHKRKYTRRKVKSDSNNMLPDSLNNNIESLPVERDSDPANTPPPVAIAVLRLPTKRERVPAYTARLSRSSMPRISPRMRKLR